MRKNYSLKTLAVAGSNSHHPGHKALIRRGNVLASWRIGSVILCAFFGCCISGAFGQEATKVKIGYLRTTEQRTTISLIELPAPNDGLAGAELAIDDNNTTGRFLKQSFSLDDVKLKPQDDPAAALNALAGQGVSMVIADLPPDQLLKAADAGRAQGMLFFNAVRQTTG